MLDIAQALLGEDTLLYNVVYIVKEPHASAHVTWHQDLTYWGLSFDRVVSAWLALSPASDESGCMTMIPASHSQGPVPHLSSNDESNVLLDGQYVEDVDETAARLYPLAPGEASFHHGWTLHSSRANASNNRRIGLNIQYLATSVSQTLHNRDTAFLVRGVDTFGHFGTDIPAVSDLGPDAVERQRKLQRSVRETHSKARQQG